MPDFPPDLTNASPDRIFRTRGQGGGQQEVRFSPLRVGEAVIARGVKWQIRAVRHHLDCVEVRLASRSRRGGFVLLSPFDRLRPDSSARRWRRGSLDVVISAAARAVNAASGTGRIAAAALRSPGLALLDWQLEAGLALYEGHASRVLVADAVGLGKTVQAGLAEALLCDAGVRDRTLILAPGGVRDQWCAELQRLFAVQPQVMDAARLTRLRRTLPAHVNPWLLPGIVVAAIDFVKQPEVLAGLVETRWTLVVLDEAHAFTGQTDRHRAAHLIARSARYVLLLTATPHSGNEAAFRDLCRIGALDDEPLMIRRTRAQVGITIRRRNRRLMVRPTRAERRLHRRLTSYLAAVRRDRVMDSEHASLTAWVLLKRAASSARALRTTLIHRRRVLAGDSPALEQPELPFVLTAGEFTDDDAPLPDVLRLPGLRNRHFEVRQIDRLVALAGAAAAHDSKIAVARRFVLRVREPIILFTEFRDTLDEIAAALTSDVSMATLHGGMTRRERHEAERAFTTGAVRVLLATDAASEGLNLHHACRLVINVDVPWSPVRLEQRIGRVDRMGQRRTVHAVTLVGHGAHETPILERVAERLHRIRRDLGEAADPLGLTGDAEVPEPGDRSPSLRMAEHTDGRQRCSERHALLAAILGLMRGSSRGVGQVAQAPPTGTRLEWPWTPIDRPRRRRLGLPPGVLLVFRGHAVTAADSVAAVACVAVMVELDPAIFAALGPTSVVKHCAAVAAVTAAPHLRRALAEALPAYQRRTQRFRNRLTSALQVEPESTPPYQPGLFDRRAMTAALRERAVSADRRSDLRQTIEGLADEDVIVSVDMAPVAALLLR